MSDHDENPFEGLSEMTPSSEMCEMPESPIKNRRTFLKYSVAAAVAAGMGGALWKIDNIMQKDHDPFAIARRYRDPDMTKSLIAPTWERYPYTRSALLMHIDEERRLIPDYEDGVHTMIVIANNIANRVAQTMQRRIGASSISESLRTIGKTEESLKQYCEAVATELRRVLCFYAPEQSFHNAVSASDTFIHLDCNLLCHVALHCASRHDIPIHAVSAPNHMYIGSPAYRDFAIEMTAFRDRPTVFEPYIDKINSAFFSSHDEQRAIWEFANDYVEDTFGFFEPMDEERMIEGAVAEILTESIMRIRRDYEIESFCKKVDNELSRFIDPLYLPTYALNAHITAQKVSESNGRKEEAIEHKKRIDELRGRFADRFMVDLSTEGEPRRLWWLKEKRGDLPNPYRDTEEDRRVLR